MRATIDCTAQTLSQLRPDMLRAIAHPSEFQNGYAYFSEERAQLMTVRDHAVTSLVKGKTQVYRQRVRLRGGRLPFLSRYLEVACSCTHAQPPVCRHGIAVLLAYHRKVHPDAWPAAREYQAPERPTPSTPEHHHTREPQSAPNSHSTPESRSTDDPVEAVSSLGRHLHGLACLIEWIQLVGPALERDEPLPVVPFDALPAEAAAFVHALEILSTRLRQGEVDRKRLEDELREQSAHVERVTQEVGVANQEAKAARAACDDLGRQLAVAQAGMAELQAVQQRHTALQAQFAALAEEIRKRGTSLEHLSDSLAQLAAELRTLGALGSPPIVVSVSVCPIPPAPPTPSLSPSAAFPQQPDTARLDRAGRSRYRKDP